MTQFIVGGIVFLLGCGCGWFLHYRFGSKVAAVAAAVETDVKAFGKPK